MTGRRAPAPLRTGSVLVLVVAIGLNLRATFGAVPPLVPDIRAELSLSATQAGLLTSAPILLMGLCAPLGQRTARRLGQEPAMVVFLGMLGVAAGTRVMVPDALALVATAVAMGGAIGALSSLVPAFIGHHLPRLRGTATGVYSTSMALGVALAAAVTGPLAEMLGGWRASLAVWGVTAGAVALALLTLLPRLNAPHAPDSHRPADGAIPRGGRIGMWLVALTTTVMTLLGFSTIAWLSPAFEHQGMPPGRAALMLVLFQGVQVFSMLTLPALTDVLSSKRVVFVIVLFAAAAGMALLAFAPLSLAVPASLLAGFGIGGGSSLALVLIQYAATNREEANRISAWSMLFAYSVAATGPLALGALRDLTGGFTAGYTVLLLVALTSFALLIPLRALNDRTSATARKPLPTPDNLC